MILAIIALPAGIFIALCVRQLKADLGQERDFQAKLSGFSGSFVSRQ